MKTKKLKALIKKCHHLCHCTSGNEQHKEETIYVGSSRRRYVIDTKRLRHPLINALIEKSRKGENGNGVEAVEGNGYVSINVEVVLFDHLLWMLENADPSIFGPDQSLEDLAELYML